MKQNYGSTPLGAQMAMIGELEQLFEGRKFWGQGQRKALRLFCQDVEIPTENDDDDEPAAAIAPFVVFDLAKAGIAVALAHTIRQAVPVLRNAQAAR